MRGYIGRLGLPRWPPTVSRPNPCVRFEACIPSPLTLRKKITMADYPHNEKRLGAKPTSRVAPSGTRSNHKSGVRKMLKDKKHSDALVRNAAWVKLSPKEQQASLGASFGSGKGAVKQRKKIAIRAAK